LAPRYRLVTASADTRPRQLLIREESTMTTKTRLLILAPVALLIAQIVGGIRYSG
jgi:hypothetical protein